MLFRHFSLALFGVQAAGCCKVLVAGCRLSCFGQQLAVGLPCNLLIAFLARLGLFSLIGPVGGLSGHS